MRATLRHLRGFILAGVNFHFSFSSLATLELHVLYIASMKTIDPQVLNLFKIFGFSFSGHGAAIYVMLSNILSNCWSSLSVDSETTADRKAVQAVILTAL